MIRNLYIYSTSIPTHTQKLIYNIINLCSPCKDIRGEAHHKCANECTDFLGGSLPPPLLLIQAFLAHTAKAHRYHYLPRRHDQRHADIMKQSTEETWDGHEESSELCSVISEDYTGEISLCIYISYINTE